MCILLFQVESGQHSDEENDLPEENGEVQEPKKPTVSFAPEPQMKIQGEVRE